MLKRHLGSALMFVFAPSFKTAQTKKENAACAWFYSGQREICIPLQINFCLRWELREGSKQTEKANLKQAAKEKQTTSM